MNKFQRFAVSLAAAAGCLACAGTASAAKMLTKTITYMPQTVNPSQSYTITFNYFDVTTPSYIDYIEYFGKPVTDNEIDEYQVGLFSGTGSYTIPGTFTKKVSLEYFLVSSVPEPATWAMMLAGFGAIGLGLRGSKRRGLRTA